MPDLPDENGKQRIRVIYSRLEAVWNGLDGMTDDIVGGVLVQHQQTLDELESLAENDYDSFMPHTREVDDEHHIACRAQDLRVQVSGLMGELRPLFAAEQRPHYAKESEGYVLSVNQYVSQEVNVTQNLVVDIALKLESLEGNYAENTPEKNFIVKLKDGLKSVKDVASLIGLLVTTAQSVGLGIDKLEQILRALHLA